MPLAQCRGRGGLMVIRGRPLDIKPGWTGEVSVEDLARYPFLMPVEEWPDDVYVLEEVT